MSETKVTQLGEKSVYVENNTGNIAIHFPNGEVKIINAIQVEDIKSAFQSVLASENKKHVVILVLCENESVINSHEETKSIAHYYGPNICDWKPYATESIKEMFDKYKESALFDITLISCSDMDDANIAFKVKFEDDLLPKTIVITDGLCISDKSKSFSRSIDYKRDIGGFLIPLHEGLDEKIKSFFSTKFSENYSRMYTRINTYWNIPYENIEIGVKKEDFFKRITNFACKLLDIRANTNDAFSSYNNIKGINGLTPDGQQKII